MRKSGKESHSAKISGTRPIFNQLLADIQNQTFNGILTWAPDRLSRNAGDLGMLVDLMDQEKLLQIKTFSQTFSNNPNEKFLLKMKKLISENRQDEAHSICQTGGKRGLPKIVKAALENRDAPPDLLKSCVEEEVVVLSSKVERRVPYFATIGNVATLVGLMGTIYGLVLAFAAVGKPGVPAAVKTSMLASGISTAMNTTIFGLMVAIPTLIVYTYISNRTAKIIDELDEHLVKLINLITGNR